MFMLGLIPILCGKTRSEQLFGSFHLILMVKCEYFSFQQGGRQKLKLEIHGQDDHYDREDREGDDDHNDLDNHDVFNDYKMTTVS